VGVGPGDPRLLTTLAIETIRQADRVVAPTTGPGDPGRAESIVRAALGDISITRLPFAMAVEGSGVEAGTGHDLREASHRAAAEELLPLLDNGSRVAFVTLGDPNVYSTFPSLVAALRQLGWEGSSSTVPGITAFQDLAARSGTVLLDGTESLSLVTALDGPHHVEAALSRADQAVVVYKGGRHLPAIVELLRRTDRLHGAVVGELLGLPGERVASLSETDAEPASYLATILVPPSGGAAGTARASS
jgi:precorrin-2/cobalt-factor-2 C20-methyltransferase